MLQRNVLSWNDKRHSYVNIYTDFDPDIILLNETGILDGEKMTIFNYNIFRANRTIGLKKTFDARIDDEFHQDLKGEPRGTGYVPPRLGYLDTTDLDRMFNRDHPVYF